MNYNLFLNNNKLVIENWLKKNGFQLQWTELKEKLFKRRKNRKRNEKIKIRKTWVQRRQSKDKQDEDEDDEDEEDTNHSFIILIAYFLIGKTNNDSTYFIPINKSIA